MRYPAHYKMELLIALIVFLLVTSIAGFMVTVSWWKHWFHKKKNFARLERGYLSHPHSFDYKIYVWATEMETFVDFTADVGFLVDTEEFVEALRRVRLFATDLYLNETLQQIMARMERWGEEVEAEEWAEFITQKKEALDIDKWFSNVRADIADYERMHWFGHPPHYWTDYRLPESKRHHHRDSKLHWLAQAHHEYVSKFAPVYFPLPIDSLDSVLGPDCKDRVDLQTYQAYSDLEPDFACPLSRHSMESACGGDGGSRLRTLYFPSRWWAFKTISIVIFIHWWISGWVTYLKEVHWEEFYWEEEVDPYFRWWWKRIKEVWLFDDEMYDNYVVMSKDLLLERILDDDSVEVFQQRLITQPWTWEMPKGSESWFTPYHFDELTGPFPQWDQWRVDYYYSELMEDGEQRAFWSGEISRMGNLPSTRSELARTSAYYRHEWGSGRMRPDSVQRLDRWREQFWKVYVKKSATIRRFYKTYITLS